MISRQIVATLLFFRGPGLAASRPLMTWASRSGRNTVEPSARLISPTSLASAARRFRAASSSRSTASISVRSWARVRAMASGFAGAGIRRVGIAVGTLRVVLHDALQAAELGALVQAD